MGEGHKHCYFDERHQLPILHKPATMTLNVNECSLGKCRVHCFLNLRLFFCDVTTYGQLLHQR